MWLAIVIGVAVIGYAFLVVRAVRLNNAPLQKELAALIMEMMAAGADRSAQSIFSASVTGRFMGAMILDQSARQTPDGPRPVHAQTDLSDQGYQAARQITRFT